MGYDRGRLAVRHVARSSAAMSWRRPRPLDRIAGRGAEYLHLVVQFASVRFSRRMDVRARRRSGRRHDARGATAPRLDRIGRTVMAPNEPIREKMSIGSMFSRVLSARHDPLARIRNVDLLAGLVVVLLPWSTSGVAIGMVVWLFALLPTMELRPFLRSLRRPVCMLPIVLVILAALGTLWP